MQLSRARALLSAGTIHQGASSRSRASSNCVLGARVARTQCARDLRSIGLNFHRFVGSLIRFWKRSSCSSSLTENQYFRRTIPERMSMRSNSGQDLMNSTYFLLGAKPHDALDAGPVVPASVEQDDLASGRQVRRIALKVPLRLLPLSRRAERHDPASAWVQGLRVIRLMTPPFPAASRPSNRTTTLRPFSLTYPCSFPSSTSES